MGKPTLVLVPGLLCDHALWQAQVAALSDLADCVVTDQHLRHESIGAIAEAIAADAPGRFALAGLSMGGYIALEICRRFGARVTRLALLDTSARADTPEQTRRREALVATARSGGFAGVVALLYPLLVHPDRIDDPVLEGRIADMAHRAGPEAFVRQQQAIIGRLNQVPHLKQIACPTVIICGAQDQVTPLDCAEELAAGIHGARLEVIAGCGHMSTMEAPETVSARLIGWLSV